VPESDEIPQAAMTLTETSPVPITPSPNGQTDHAPGDKEMTLLQHLEELRGRLVACAAAVVIGILVSIIPVPGLGSITEAIVKLLAELAPAGKLSTFGPGEGFFAFLEVAMIIGFAVAMPVIVFQVLSFVTPALYENERKYLYIAVPGVTLSFAAGVLFCYFLMLPFAIVGFVVARKQPRNPIGWVMLGIGQAIAAPFGAYARYALLARHGALPGTRQADPQAGVLALPRTIDDTAHDRNMNGSLNFGEPLLYFISNLDDIDFDASTRGTGDKGNATIT